jgi:hypothetical protein
MLAALDKRVAEDSAPHTRKGRHVAERPHDGLNSSEVNR